MIKLLIFDEDGSFGSHIGPGKEIDKILMKNRGIDYEILDDRDNVNLDIRIKKCNSKYLLIIHTKSSTKQDNSDWKVEFRHRHEKILKTIKLNFPKLANITLYPVSSESDMVTEFYKNEFCIPNVNCLRYGDLMFPSDLNLLNKTDFFKPKKISKFFISHSSKDHYLVKLFIEKILSNGMGVSIDEIFFANKYNYRVPVGVNVPEEIHEVLKSSVFFISFISEKYLESPICMLEMGASLITHDKNKRIIINLGHTNFESYFDLGLRTGEVNQSSLESIFTNNNSTFIEIFKSSGLIYHLDNCRDYIKEFIESLITIPKNEITENEFEKLYPDDNLYYKMYK
jgi:hypothetical protein